MSKRQQILFGRYYIVSEQIMSHLYSWNDWLEWSSLIGRKRTNLQLVNKVLHAKHNENFLVNRWHNQPLIKPIQRNCNSVRPTTFDIPKCQEKVWRSRRRTTVCIFFSIDLFVRFSSLI